MLSVMFYIYIYWKLLSYMNVENTSCRAFKFLFLKNVYSVIYSLYIMKNSNNNNENTNF